MKSGIFKNILRPVILISIFFSPVLLIFNKTLNYSSLTLEDIFGFEIPVINSDGSTSNGLSHGQTIAYFLDYLLDVS